MVILLRTEKSALSKLVKICKPAKYPYCVSCVSVCREGVEHLFLSTWNQSMDF